MYSLADFSSYFVSEIVTAALVNCTKYLLEPVIDYVTKFDGNAVVFSAAILPRGFRKVVRKDIRNRTVDWYCGACSFIVKSNTRRRIDLIKKESRKPLRAMRPLQPISNQKIPSPKKSKLSTTQKKSKSSHSSEVAASIYSTNLTSARPPAVCCCPYFHLNERWLLQAYDPLTGAVYKYILRAKSIRNIFCDISTSMNYNSGYSSLSVDSYLRRQLPLDFVTVGVPFVVESFDYNESPLLLSRAMEPLTELLRVRRQLQRNRDNSIRFRCAISETECAISILNDKFSANMAYEVEPSAMEVEDLLSAIVREELRLNAATQRIKSIMDLSKTRIRDFDSQRSGKILDLNSSLDRFNNGQDWKGLNAKRKIEKRIIYFLQRYFQLFNQIRHAKDVVLAFEAERDLCIRNVALLKSELMQSEKASVVLEKILHDDTVLCVQVLRVLASNILLSTRLCRYALDARDDSQNYGEMTAFLRPQTLPSNVVASRNMLLPAFSNTVMRLRDFAFSHLSGNHYDRPRSIYDQGWRRLFHHCARIRPLGMSSAETSHETFSCSAMIEVYHNLGDRFMFSIMCNHQDLLNGSFPEENMTELDMAIPDAASLCRFEDCLSFEERPTTILISANEAQMLLGRRVEWPFQYGKEGPFVLTDQFHDLEAEAICSFQKTRIAKESQRKRTARALLKHLRFRDVTLRPCLGLLHFYRRLRNVAYLIGQTLWFRDLQNQYLTSWCNEIHANYCEISAAPFKVSTQISLASLDIRFRGRGRLFTFSIPMNDVLRILAKQPLFLISFLSELQLNRFSTESISCVLGKVNLVLPGSSWRIPFQTEMYTPVYSLRDSFQLLRQVYNSARVFKNNMYRIRIVVSASDIFRISAQQESSTLSVDDFVIELSRSEIVSLVAASCSNGPNSAAANSYRGSLFLLRWQNMSTLLNFLVDFLQLSHCSMSLFNDPHDFSQEQLRLSFLRFHSWLRRRNAENRDESFALLTGTEDIMSEYMQRSLNKYKENLNLCSSTINDRRSVTFSYDDPLQEIDGKRLLIVFNDRWRMLSPMDLFMTSLLSKSPQMQDETKIFHELVGNNLKLNFERKSELQSDFESVQMQAEERFGFHFRESSRQLSRLPSELMKSSPRRKFEKPNRKVASHIVSHFPRNERLEMMVESINREGQESESHCAVACEEEIISVIPSLNSPPVVPILEPGHHNMSSTFSTKKVEQSASNDLPPDWRSVENRARVIRYAARRRSHHALCGCFDPLDEVFVRSNGHHERDEYPLSHSDIATAEFFIRDTESSVPCNKLICPMATIEIDLNLLSNLSVRLMPSLCIRLLNSTTSYESGAIHSSSSTKSKPSGESPVLQVDLDRFSSMYLASYLSDNSGVEKIIILDGIVDDLYHFIDSDSRFFPSSLWSTMKRGLTICIYNWDISSRILCRIHEGHISALQNLMIQPDAVSLASNIALSSVGNIVVAATVTNASKIWYGGEKKQTSVTVQRVRGTLLRHGLLRRSRRNNAEQFLSSA